MWVEPELLHSGGDVARSAGQRVLGGAEALSAAAIGSSIFGDFDAARSFHQRLSAHRTSRVDAMRGNHQTLTDVGQKAQTASGWFSQTERENTRDVSHITDA
ncbi:DUF2563 family protein [Mycolicibacterium stellerae]|uniref:DUF2563 family protein n=1 Tax=Mycolicibacterium stellerae TaxID=2358193 RepID=UPI000F0B0B6A|nr:DUF2563 family protein [Mycolicibacterium stellerae]